jgi:hypothetical protein
MAGKLIFLSHIHEEKRLAITVKSAIEDEFSGFVDVFVSLDASSIPAGANFLKRIEDKLVDCVGAVYLVSPVSVKRNWINFELGAVWIRNILNIRENNTEISLIPLCHSGIQPSSLPLPLNNLNGILGSQSSQLEFSFRSLQIAVGGRGKLKTDFDALAKSVIAFELDYTLGANIRKMFDLLGGDKRLLVEECEKLAHGIPATIDCGFVENSVIDAIKSLEANELRGHIKVIAQNAGVGLGPNRAINGAKLKIIIAGSLVVQFKTKILL